MEWVELFFKFQLDKGIFIQILVMKKKNAILFGLIFEDLEL
jgi:hypothetical protein